MKTLDFWVTPQSVLAMGVGTVLTFGFVAYTLYSREAMGQVPAEKFELEQIVVAPTGQPRTISWCNVEGQTGPEWTHRIEIYEFPPKDGALPVAAHDAVGDVTSWVYTPSNAGVYYAQVRSCDADACSAWNISITRDEGGPGCITDPTRFVMYFKLAAPTGGGID